MKNNRCGEITFFEEMAERQISAREFFSNVLLDSLRRNFGLKHVLILCFDQANHFLSWTDSSGITISGEANPYTEFADKDPVSSLIYKEAVRDELDYFNVKPRLYRSADVLQQNDCNADYVGFIEENFGMHYSVTMAFGINAYIRICCFKSRNEGDFTDEEMQELENIYIYVANLYKNFKKYEQEKIVSNIQDEIISSGEKAYLITDDFMHVMSYNRAALQFLKQIFGPATEEQLSNTSPCVWLPFLLEGDETGGEAGSAGERVRTRVVKGFVFKIYTYDQKYSHGIIDRYHWITISEKEGREAEEIDRDLKLTQAERRVAELLCQGLTYQAIADELIISYHTVKKHIQNIYSKCGVKSRYQLYTLLTNEKPPETFRR